LTQSSVLIDTQGVFRAPILEQFAWLEHGFGTRTPVGWPDPERLAMLKQIHSAKVVEANGAAGFIGEGDALITDRPGVMVGVRTADCVPILIVDSRKRVVAAVHAGWRGSAQRIVVCTISEMAGHFGTSPEDVYAVIGPAIGHCCYEVGPEVAREFIEWFPELALTNGPVRLDLAETNRRQLRNAGVAGDRIVSGAPCTFCTPETLHSYRRDREAAGRMVSAVGIRNSRQRG
jgi:YfiH family protein